MPSPQPSSALQLRSGAAVTLAERIGGGGEGTVYGLRGQSSAVAAQGDSAATRPAKEEPFAFADWTWLNGNPRTKDLPFDSKFFTPEIRVDIAYHYDFNQVQSAKAKGSALAGFVAAESPCISAAAGCPGTDATDGAARFDAVIDGMFGPGPIGATAVPL